jgi:monoamine oxidase
MIFFNLPKKKVQTQPVLSVHDLGKQFSANADFLHLLDNLVTDAATKPASLSAGEMAKMTGKLMTKDYRFEDLTMYGFLNKVFGALIKENVLLNTAVSAIDYAPAPIKVHDHRGSTHECDKVVVTIPISELKSNAIRFLPDLPTEQTAAFRLIGMDKGLKVFLKFDHKFFQQGFFNGHHAAYYIDPSHQNDTSDKGILASLIMGKHADAYYANPGKTAERYLSELDALYGGKASQHFEGLLAQDWGNEAFVNGVYSYTMPGGEKAREVARKSLDNKVFFAGEAMNTSLDYGNVHGAMDSVAHVINSIK